VRLRAIPKSSNVYKGFEPLLEDIADIIHFVVSRPYHVNIADLIVLPTAQAAATILKEIIYYLFLLIIYKTFKKMANYNSLRKMRFILAREQSNHIWHLIQNTTLGQDYK
jgi:hypothetical protein